MPTVSLPGRPVPHNVTGLTPTEKVNSPRTCEVWIDFEGDGELAAQSAIQARLALKSRCRGLHRSESVLPDLDLLESSRVPCNPLQPAIFTQSAKFR